MKRNTLKSATEILNVYLTRVVQAPSFILYNVIAVFWWQRVLYRTIEGVSENSKFIWRIVVKHNISC